MSDWSDLKNILVENVGLKRPEKYFSWECRIEATWKTFYFGMSDWTDLKDILVANVGLKRLEHILVGNVGISDWTDPKDILFGNVGLNN